MWKPKFTNGHTCLDSKNFYSMTTGYSIIQNFFNKLTGNKSIFLDSSSLLGFFIFKNLSVSILLYFSNISGTKDSTCFGRFKKKVGIYVYLWLIHTEV